MGRNEFMTSTALIFGVMALLALIEVAIPLFARGASSRGRSGANLTLMASTLLLNWALNSALAAVALIVPFEGFGLSSMLAAWTLPAGVAISVFALDLSTYFAHRSMHQLPLLWQVHRVHHSDPFVDVTTTLRQHPLEGLWRFLFLVIPIWGLGLPIQGVLVYRGISAIQALVEHANIRLWRPLDRMLSYVWCTPNMHKVHHSQESGQTDSNYGNLFAFIDRGLRTFTPTDQAYAVEYGLADADPIRARRFDALMRLQFTG